MPDITSFLISAKNQEDLKSGIIRKKNKKKPTEDDDEDDNFEEYSAPAKQSNSGTRSRPANG